MTGESEAAGVWAALLGLSLFIAVTVTVGVWFCIYRDEAAQMQPYATEPCTTFQMIWEDVGVPLR